MVSETSVSHCRMIVMLAPATQEASMADSSHTGSGTPRRASMPCNDWLCGDATVG